MSTSQGVNKNISCILIQIDADPDKNLKLLDSNFFLISYWTRLGLLLGCQGMRSTECHSSFLNQSIDIRAQGKSQVTILSPKFVFIYHHKKQQIFTFEESAPVTVDTFAKEIISIGHTGPDGLN